MGRYDCIRGPTLRLQVGSHISHMHVRSSVKSPIRVPNSTEPSHTARHTGQKHALPDRCCNAPRCVCDETDNPRDDEGRRSHSPRDRTERGWGPPPATERGVGWVAPANMRRDIHICALHTTTQISILAISALSRVNGFVELPLVSLLRARSLGELFHISLLLFRDRWAARDDGIRIMTRTEVPSAAAGAPFA